MKKEKFDVFISYRREGADSLAQSIFDRLKQRGYRVFLDIESLTVGKFNEQIYEVLDECQVILLVLPPGGLDRCINDNDWVRREVAYGILKGKKIIPIMMEGFAWPDTLPEDICELANYEGVEDSKKYYNAEIIKICQLMNIVPVKKIRRFLWADLVVGFLLCVLALVYQDNIRIFINKYIKNTVVYSIDKSNEINSTKIYISSGETEYVRTVLAAIGYREFKKVDDLKYEHLIGVTMNLPDINAVCVNTKDIIQYGVVETGGVYVEDNIVKEAINGIFKKEISFDNNDVSLEDLMHIEYDKNGKCFWKDGYSIRGNFYDICIEDMHLFGEHGIKVDYIYSTYKTNKDYKEYNATKEEHYTAYFEKNKSDKYPYHIVKVEKNMSDMLTEEGWLPLCVTDANGNIFSAEEFFGEYTLEISGLSFFDEDSEFDNKYGLSLKNYTGGFPDGMRWGDYSYDGASITLWGDSQVGGEPLNLLFGEYEFNGQIYTTLCWRDKVNFHERTDEEVVIYFAKESEIVDGEEYLGNKMY